MKRIRQQQGVALLVVLILLVMMSALAAKISQQFCRNLQKTHYQVSQQQLRWAMQARGKSGEGPVTDRRQRRASRWRWTATGISRWRRRVKITRS